jgi:UDP-N-acetylmuramoyl-tripeptide--D-alanyl-D-alanine ligase
VTAHAETTAAGMRLDVAAPTGAFQIDLSLNGAHNVHNALAATAAALAAGIRPADIAAGLAAFAPVKGRGARHVLPSGALLVDDSYNANPDSVRAAIDLLMTLPAPHWLVLGDMGAVGTQGPQFHAEVGAYARERGVEQLWLAGAACADTARAFGPGARHFAGTPELIAALDEAPHCASALIKGSRFMAMERVVRALVPNEGPAHAH